MITEIIEPDSASSATKLAAISFGIPSWSDGEYAEGLLVRIVKKDGNAWIGRFAYGSSNLDKVLVYPEHNRIIVFAHGQMWIVNTEDQKASVDKLPYSFDTLLEASDGRLVTYDFTDLYIIELNGDIWRSERISWDGFEEMTIENQTVQGLSYTPIDSTNEWQSFTFNIETKERIGGAYKENQKS